MYNTIIFVLFFRGLIYICVPDELVSVFKAFIYNLVKKNSIIYMLSDYSKDFSGLRYKIAPNLDPIVRPEYEFPPCRKGAC